MSIQPSSKPHLSTDAFPTSSASADTKELRTRKKIKDTTGELFRTTTIFPPGKTNLSITASVLVKETPSTSSESYQSSVEVASSTSSSSSLLSKRKRSEENISIEKGLPQTEKQEKTVTRVRTQTLARSTTHPPRIRKTLPIQRAVSHSSQIEETRLQQKERKEANMQKMIANAQLAYDEHARKELNLVPPQPFVINKQMGRIKVTTELAERKGIRPSMEDAHFLEEIKGGYLVGIFDGHGGKDVATRASLAFPNLFSDALKEKKGDVYEAMRSSIKDLQSTIVSHKRLRQMGSTMVASYITKQGTIYTATVGDSEAFHYRCDDEGNYSSQPLSLVRDWSSLSEATRAAQLANSEGQRKFIQSTWPNNPNPKALRVSSVNHYTLNLSRGIGDLSFPEVSSEPTLTVDQIGKKGIIGFFCDGITDFVTQREIVDLLKSTPADHTADAIADYALEQKRSTDNVTALLLRITRKDSEA